MKFIVGSASKRKIDVAERLIRQFFFQDLISIEGFAAASLVPDTPYGKETFDGSRNRALGSKENIEGDFYIGMESGLIERHGHIYEEAWVTVVDKEGEEFYGYSSGLKVPDFILKKMDELNLEHCHVMEIIEKEFGAIPNDTWGTYSGGMIAREVSLEEAMRNAFIQIVAPESSFYVKK